MTENKTIIPTIIPVNVGVVLDDLHSVWEDMVELHQNGPQRLLYASHVHYKTRLVLHFRDAKKNVVHAAAAGSYFP